MLELAGIGMRGRGGRAMGTARRGGDADRDADRGGAELSWTGYGNGGGITTQCGRRTRVRESKSTTRGETRGQL